MPETTDIETRIRQRLSTPRGSAEDRIRSRLAGSRQSLPYDLERNPIPASRYNEPEQPSQNPFQQFGEGVLRGTAGLAVSAGSLVNPKAGLEAQDMLAREFPAAGAAGFIGQAAGSILPTAAALATGGAGAIPLIGGMAAAGAGAGREKVAGVERDTGKDVPGWVEGLAAIGYAGAELVPEAVQFKSLLKILNTRYGRELAEETAARVVSKFKAAAKGAGKGSLGEAVEEAATELGQAGIDVAVDPRDKFFSAETGKRVLKAGGSGAIGGTVVGGGAGYTAAKRAQGQPLQTPEALAELEAAQGARQDKVRQGIVQPEADATPAVKFTPNQQSDLQAVEKQNALEKRVRERLQAPQPALAPEDALNTLPAEPVAQKPRKMKRAESVQPPPAPLPPVAPPAPPVAPMPEAAPVAKPVAEPAPAKAKEAVVRGTEAETAAAQEEVRASDWAGMEGGGGSIQIVRKESSPLFAKIQATVQRITGKAGDRGQFGYTGDRRVQSGNFLHNPDGSTTYVDGNGVIQFDAKGEMVSSNWKAPVRDIDAEIKSTEGTIAQIDAALAGLQKRTIKADPIHGIFEDRLESDQSFQARKDSLNKQRDNLIKKRDGLKAERDTTPPPAPAKAKEATSRAELAGLQRGEPEAAMLEIQRTSSGLYGYIAESTGDILHRMNGGSGERLQSISHAETGPKLERSLQNLTLPYGYEKEVMEQVQSNAKHGGESIEAHLAKLKAAGEAYAQAFESLPVHNESQRLAQQAAVAHGRWDFKAEIDALKKLKAVWDKGKDAWDEFVNADYPDLAPKSTPAKAKAPADISAPPKANEGAPKPAPAAKGEGKQSPKARALQREQDDIAHITESLERNPEKAYIAPGMGVSMLVKKLGGEPVPGELNYYRKVKAADAKPAPVAKAKEAAPAKADWQTGVDPVSRFLQSTVREIADAKNPREMNAAIQRRDKIRRSPSHDVPNDVWDAVISVAREERVGGIMAQGFNRQEAEAVAGFDLGKRIKPVLVNKETGDVIAPSPPPAPVKAKAVVPRGTQPVPNDKPGALYPTKDPTLVKSVALKIDGTVYEGTPQDYHWTLLRRLPPDIADKYRAMSQEEQYAKAYGFIDLHGKFITGNESLKLVQDRQVAQQNARIASRADALRTPSPAPADISAPPPEGAPKAAGKEAWEMTREEYLKPKADAIGYYGGVSLHDLNAEIRTTHEYRESLRKIWDKKLDSLTPKGSPPTPEAWATVEAMPEYIEYNKKRPDVDKVQGFGQTHRFAVRDALTQGKPVPPEVLADYPDLRLKPAPAAKGEGKVRRNAKIADVRVGDEIYATGDKAIGSVGGIVKKINPVTIVIESEYFGKPQTLTLRKNEFRGELSIKPSPKPATAKEGKPKMTGAEANAVLNDFLKSDEGSLKWEDIDGRVKDALLVKAREVYDNGARTIEDFTAAMKEWAGDKYNRIAAHVGKMHAAIQPPEEKEGAKEETGTPKFTKAQILTDRDVLGLESLPEHERKAWTVSVEGAREKGYDRNAITIAVDFLTGDDARPLSDEEIAGVYVHYTTLRRERGDLIDRLGDAKAGKEEDGLLAQLESVEERMGTLLEAIDKTQPMGGRSSSILRMARDVDDYSPANLDRQTKAAVKRNVSPKEKAFNRTVSEKVEKQAKVVDALQKDRAKLVKEEQDRKRKADAAAEVKKAAGKSKVKTAREKSLKVIDRMAKELAAMGMRVNDITGLAPEAIWKIGRMAIEYAKIAENVAEERIESVVAKVRERLPDLTAEDIYEAITSTNPKAKQRVVGKAELAIRTLKKNATALLALKGWGERQKTRLSANKAALGRKYEEAKRVAEKTAADKQAKISRDLRLYVERQKVRIALEEHRKADKALEAQRVERLKKLEAELKAKEEQAKKDKALADYVAQQQVRVALEAHRKAVKASEADRQNKLSRVVEAGFIERQAKSLLLQLRRDSFYSGYSRRELTDIQAKISEALDYVKIGDYEAADEAIKVLQKRMAVADKIQDYRTQLETGEFKEPPKVERVKDPAKLDEAKRILARLKKDWRVHIEAKKRTLPQKVLRAAFSINRAFLTAGDMGAGLVQGILLASAHPKKFSKSWAKAFASYWSEGKFEQMDFQLRNMHEQYNRNRMEIRMLDKETGVLEGESDFVHKVLKVFPFNLIPKPIVDSGERFYSTFLNHFRAGLADDFMARHPNATIEEMKAMGDYINVFTGSGDLGKFKMAADVLSTVFFAPRFAASRFQVPARLAWGYRQYPRVRKEMMRDMLSFTITAMTAATLAKLNGFDVGLNPRTADFLRVKIGNTRIDFTGGLSSVLRIFARTGLLLTDRAGLTGQDLSASKKRFDALEALSSFALMRLNPSVQWGRSLMTGRDFRGQPITALGATQEAFTPLFVQDAIDAWKSDGAMAGLGAGLAGFTGVRVSTWQDKQSTAASPYTPFKPSVFKPSVFKPQTFNH